MKTIAISIDEESLAGLDRLIRKPGGSGNRSSIVRLAVRDYLSRAGRLAEETREREILRRHRERLRRQASALMKGQAQP